MPPTRLPLHGDSRAQRAGERASEIEAVKLDRRGRHPAFPNEDPNMIPQPPPGQGPIDPRGVFVPPPPPGGGQAPVLPRSPQGAPSPQGMGAPPQFPPGGYPPGMTFGPGPGPGGAGPVPGGYPSYGMAPPFLRPPFGPPPRRGGVLRGLLIALLIMFLVVSLIVNVALIASSDGGSRAQQSTVLSGNLQETVAIVPLEGLIDDRQTQRFDRLMTRAENDKNIKALVVRIDTPGGGVTASDELYERIRKFKSKKDGIPVVISMGGMATSGGYYAACAGDHLFAEETTLTGNIGVLMPSYNVSKLMSKYGVEDQTIVSTGAIYKTAGSMTVPQTEKDRAYLQGIADSMFARFKQVVVAGRGSNLKGNIDTIADGRVYVLAEALQAGLVDEKGYLEDAIQYAVQKAHLSKPTVVRLHETPSFFDLFASESSSRIPGRGASGSVTVNGINLNIDPETVDRFATPRMMYLWRGQ